MTIDGTTAWVGTSNWSGGYFDNSRNLELVLNNASMAARVDALYSQLWNSRYAAPIRSILIIGSASAASSNR